MKQFIDCEATIQDFFKTAIAWLESRPVRLSDGENKEKITADYMRKVQSDPRKYTMNNAVYTCCDKLEGFFEHKVNKDGNLTTNNELYFAVIRTLDAIGKFYETDYEYTQMELLKNIKQFKIALNRKDFLKAALYKVRSPYSFAQKQK